MRFGPRISNLLEFLKLINFKASRRFYSLSYILHMVGLNVVAGGNQVYLSIKSEIMDGF